MNSTPVMAHPPFVIFALPRSRTAWLSEFLSYGDWTCNHEELRYFRSLEDVKTWFSQPYTGAAETAAAPWWRLVLRYRPDTRVVIVRRPVDEVVNSLLAIDMRGSGAFDRELLTAQIRRLDAKLDQIACRIPNAMTVHFDDLTQEATCAAVFEHCLPYRHDHAWWSELDRENIQCSVPAMVRYIAAYGNSLARLGAQAKQSILTELATKPVVCSGGLTIQQESFEAFFRDGKALFAEHLVQVGEAPDAMFDKNLELMQQMDELGEIQIMTARCNGRMFGYLMTAICPSLETREFVTAMHTTFFASKEFPGLGLKLQRASLERLKARGVGEVFMRAGVRGSGPKMGALFKRLGAETYGEMFHIPLRAA